ncbi:MAG: hypothetical protein KA792_10025 [Bacteroidales bacterium]|nr:hypothetical protein [Bacteroidales bacterium]
MKAKSLLFVSFLIGLFVLLQACKKDDIKPSNSNKKYNDNTSANASYFTSGGTNTHFTDGTNSTTYTKGGGGNSFAGGNNNQGGGNNGGGEIDNDCIIGEWVIPSDECENFPFLVSFQFGSDGTGLAYFIDSEECQIYDELHFDWYIEDEQLIITYQNDHISTTNFSCPTNHLSVQWYFEGIPQTITLIKP